MDFFIDRNVPVKLARMLDQYDHEHNVIFHDDRFEINTPDTVWLKEIVNWEPIPVVISGDGRILKNQTELQVLRELPITFFLFMESWCRLPWHERAWKTIKVWPEIVKFAAPPRPSIYRIPISARKVEFVKYTAEVGR